MNDFTALAQEYVWLSLQLHNYDPNPYIFIGAPELSETAKKNKLPKAEINQRLMTLADKIDAFATTQINGGTTRKQVLSDRIAAMQMRSRILDGEPPPSFDEEVQTLYSIEAPRKDEAHFKALARELEQVVPGNGPLPERLVAFRDRFLIDPEKIETAMIEALREARKRTLAHFELPENERVTVQMDKEGHFSGFAEYRGQGHTIVHFSQSLPLHLDRVVELAAHEAYPGHHVQGTLIEAELVGRRGWQEWTMLPLYGAHTVLAEGAANYGVGLAFDRASRIDFDRYVVLPIANLGALSGELEAYHRYVDLIEYLNFARNEAARCYLYDGWDREKAINWLMEFGLETLETATQRITIIEALRSYVVTYNCGLDWVAKQIELKKDTPLKEKWERLRLLLETPSVPFLKGKV